jgi:hypothetical protein
MLSISKYTQDYVDACRSRIDSQISADRDLNKAASDLDPSSEAPLRTAIDAFEPRFFNHMALALDNYFCHRARTIEGKDGNPLNEARVLGNSIMNNGGAMMADKTIRLNPAQSVLKYQVGDEIRLDEAQYGALSKAFFEEIERKYV